MGVDTGHSDDEDDTGLCAIKCRTTVTFAIETTEHNASKGNDTIPHSCLLVSVEIVILFQGSASLWSYHLSKRSYIASNTTSLTTLNTIGICIAATIIQLILPAERPPTNVHVLLSSTILSNWKILFELAKDTCSISFANYLEKQC